MLLVGMVGGALAYGALLAHFSEIRLIQVVQGTALATLALNVAALWKQEARDPSRTAGDRPRPRFGHAWRALNRDGRSSRRLVAVALGLVVAGGSSRVVRSSVISIRDMPYMEAARCTGCGHFRIIMRYVLPNVLAPILILATVQLGGAILAESTLSFLGFGVKPPMPAWGSMLAGSGRQFFLVAPWLAIWPGLAISLAVFGFNMLGDALRDVLDPRLRGSRAK